MSNISGNDVVRCAIYLRSACGEAGSSSFTDQERVSQGFSVAGRCYGYHAIPVTALGESTTSSPVAGVRLEILDSEAVVVRRIFSDFVSGVSASQIATALNAEQVPGPAGAKWSWRSVYAVLRRQLYRGRVHWGFSRTRRDLETGNLESYPVPASKVPHTDVAGLRIIDADLASAVDQRLATLRDKARSETES